VKLARLLEGLPEVRVSGFTDRRISSLAYDSRRLEPDGLFVAIRGHALDGHQFIPRALERGAAAVVAERPVTVPEEVSLIRVPDARRALSCLSATFYGHPSRDLDVIGVTGTNGKTTTAYLLHGILEAAGRRPALLSTVEERLGEKSAPARWTTPESLELHEFMAQALLLHHNSVVMEVSSQGLVGHRVADVRFRAGVFTNLAPEHLDVHGTMAEYGRAKSLLFRQLTEDSVAVLNADEPFSRELATVTRARRVFYGLAQQADVTGRVLELSAEGTTFRLPLCGKTLTVRTPLVGRHNVLNCLAAAAAAQAMGVEPSAIIEGIERVTAVPGRLEPVDVGQPFSVLVDYAHTDHALANVLGTLRDLTPGRLIVVFGCGGDRDRRKRPRMGVEAERRADELWVTSDNPRTEVPERIIDEILTGITDRARVHVNPDRAQAIAEALASASAGDVVVIAGKGHETYQIVGRERRPFDDRQVAREALERLVPAEGWKESVR